MMKDAPPGKRRGQAIPGSPAPLPGNSSASPKEQKEAAKNGGAKPSATCATLTKIREVMWSDVGVMRNGKELLEAIKQLGALELPKPEKLGRSGQELRNLHTLGLLMARAALAREESRGSHYRSDFAFRNDEDFSKHSALQKGKDVWFEA
jgi:L-aspartate oxidase